MGMASTFALLTTASHHSTPLPPPTPLGLRGERRRLGTPPLGIHATPCFSQLFSFWCSSALLHCPSLGLPLHHGSRRLLYIFLLLLFQKLSISSFLFSHHYSPLHFFLHCSSLISSLFVLSLLFSHYLTFRFPLSLHHFFMCLSPYVSEGISFSSSVSFCRACICLSSLTPSCFPRPFPPCQHNLPCNVGHLLVCRLGSSLSCQLLFGS